MLSTIREHVSAAASMSSPRSLQVIIASENAASALPAAALRGARQAARPAVAERGLAQSSTTVVAGRRAAFKAIDDFNDRSMLFRDKGAEISGTDRDAARRAGAARARGRGSTGGAAPRTRPIGSWFGRALRVMLLLIVIAIVTVTSVTAPVRRLIDATRRLAGGAVRTRVSRAAASASSTRWPSRSTRWPNSCSMRRAPCAPTRSSWKSKVDERTRELNHLAYHDPLTDLPNRRQLFAHLEAVDRARQAATARAWRCCSSISTTSRPSTTAWVTRSATACCRR